MAKQENVYWPSSEETNIVPVEITDEVKSSMLQYSMSVLVGRALPDVRAYEFFFIRRLFKR